MVHDYTLCFYLSYSRTRDYQFLQDLFLLYTLSTLNVMRPIRDILFFFYKSSYLFSHFLKLLLLLFTKYLFHTSTWKFLSTLKLTIIYPVRVKSESFLVFSSFPSLYTCIITCLPLFEVTLLVPHVCISYIIPGKVTNRLQTRTSEGIIDLRLK